MVEISWLWLIIGGVAVFCVGMWWGRTMLWNTFLYTCYAWWRMTGGMRRLLDAAKAKDPCTLLGIPQQLALYTADEDWYWAYFPGVDEDGAKLPELKVFVGDSVSIGDFRDPGALRSALGVSEGDGGFFPLRVCFYCIFACTGEYALTLCHRRMTLPFFAFSALRMRLPGDPICGLSFAEMPLCAPRGMERAARREIAALLRAIEHGGIPKGMTLFAQEDPEDDTTACCVMHEGLVNLNVYFGAPHALELWRSRNRGVRLRPITLNQLAPKKP
ncbi:MAG: hypothetical protein HYW56_01090 [Candidatus Harrisonbacteria bacterium]|nr:hypothetical protein [Candidatus Harrisonbacteria bacterium]